MGRASVRIWPEPLLSIERARLLGTKPPIVDLPTTQHPASSINQPPPYLPNQNLGDFDPLESSNLSLIGGGDGLRWYCDGPPMVLRWYCDGNATVAPLPFEYMKINENQ